MNYNLDKIQSRRGTNSIKWDLSSEETLPMWIADMDFGVLPGLPEALAQNLSEGHFGYNTAPDEFYEAIMEWWRKRHECKIDKAWILPTTGVVAGISAAIIALTEPEDEIIVQTPTYNHFFTMIPGCRCNVVENNLKYTDGIYTMDFEDLDIKAASATAKILLLSNPHNPVGRVWTREELEKIAEICSHHGVIVISDEIHSDLVFGDNKHVPFITIANKHNLTSITCSAASKTFNLSGLHAAYIFASEPTLKKKIETQLWALGAGTPSLMACKALTFCYQNGEEWLSQLNHYIYDNYLFLKDFLDQHLRNISIVPLEATYLVWLDCKSIEINSTDLAELLLRQEKLWLNAGIMYGNSGEGFLRLNIACPREVLKDGLERLRKGVLLV